MGMEEYMTIMAMLGLQLSYAVMALTSRAALLKGMSPRVFVVYRQAIATVAVAPIAYFFRPQSRRISMDFKSFSLIFLAALFGATMNQNFYIEGNFLATSSMATAMTNLIPAVAFVMAVMFRMESVKIRSLRSVAKIGGTVICVSGAMCMAFLRGPKLLNGTESFMVKSAIIGVESDDTWLLGCLYLFASCCCWSIWLILQVPASTSYPDNLSLTVWMCLFATIQSVIVALLVEQNNLQVWKIHSSIEVMCYLFSGIVGSGISFFVQAWCISKRGPVFPAMFNPLSTIIVTILGAIFLHEEIYTGSLLGGVVVIIGLYIVLWGKAKDYVKEETSEKLSVEEEDEEEEGGCESAEAKTNHCKTGLEEPLLLHMAFGATCPFSRKIKEKKKSKI